MNEHPYQQFTCSPAIWHKVMLLRYLFPREVLDEGQIGGVDHDNLKKTDRLSETIIHCLETIQRDNETPDFSLKHLKSKHGQAV